MTEEHKMIFDMLKAGTISVEEAEKLMAAVPEEEAPKAAKSTVRAMPQRLAVQVTENGRSRVNVKIPFPMVRAALKIGQSISGVALHFSGSQDAAVLESIKNIDFNEILNSIDSGELTLPATVADIDVEEHGGITHVLLVLE
ncbi:MAG: hypothetical protein LBS36_05755 [Oscillospiraceae bacterium]|jgi:hypothetical protein|nr:hypothetical protein [Oscillospiraceae bacterium]